jgi:hypothetical protein
VDQFEVWRRRPWPNTSERSEREYAHRRKIAYDVKLTAHDAGRAFDDLVDGSTIA